MTRPMIGFHNIETDEMTVREMNDEEFTQFESDQALANEQVAKAAAKQIVLDKLGLSVEEVTALLN